MECFDISFIAARKDITNAEVKICLNKLNALKESGDIELLRYQKDVVFYTIDDTPEIDFKEIAVGINDFCFHKENFQREIQSLTEMITSCFKCSRCLRYALCSYEYNTYLLENVTKFEDIGKPSFLAQFPFVYKQDKDGNITFEYNSKAQDIFALFKVPLFKKGNKCLI